MELKFCANTEADLDLIPKSADVVMGSYRPLSLCAGIVLKFMDTGDLLKGMSEKKRNINISVSKGSPSRGGHVEVYIYKPTELAHSFKKKKKSFFSFFPFLCLFLFLWPFQLYFIR